MVVLFHVVFVVKVSCVPNQKFCIPDIKNFEKIPTVVKKILPGGKLFILTTAYVLLGHCPSRGALVRGVRSLS